ncbi:MAG: type I-C CRISPR-associated protein Cas7/Csd2 [Polyangiaceae bacterium]
MTIQKRYDFVLLFDVQDGNPNGDPDAGNLPRVDPETGHGLVTDVCLKRKVRNYVLTAKNGISPNEIYVMESSVLNQQHARGYEARKISLGSPVEERLPKDVVADPATITDLPDGFEIEESDDEGGGFVARYDGAREKDEIKAALKTIKEACGPKLSDFFAKLTKTTKSRKATSEERSDVRQWMCDTFFDIRCFGAVMSTTVNAGQVRGPVQLTFSRSIEPIVSLEHSITRMAVTTEKEAAAQAGGNRTMGRKATVPYALYRAHGFVSPALAERVEGRRVQGTGFSDDDLALFWKALENMFEHDRSAARGLMSTRALVIFEHADKLGSAPAHELFARVTVAASEDRPANRPARRFEDYVVKLDDKRLDGVRRDVKVAATEA